MHHYITSNRFGIDVDAPEICLSFTWPGLCLINNAMVDMLYVKQSRGHCLLDADERLRISVYDYDFGVWDVEGVCMSICLVFTHFSRFDNGMPRRQTTKRFRVCSNPPLCNQTFATT